MNLIVLGLLSGYLNVADASPRLAHTDGERCYQEDQVFKRCVNQRDLFDEALTRARGRDRKLLLVYGYDGCPWSRAMMNLLTVSSKANDFRAAYEIQPIATTPHNLTGKDLLVDLMRAAGQDPTETLKAVPFLVIVNPDGTLARVLPTADFERNDPSFGWSGEDLDKVQRALLP